MIITNKMKRYLELAKRQAYNSKFEHKHGAILVRGGQVLNAAHNNVLYNSLAHRFKKKRQVTDRGSNHAEIKCILGINRETTCGSDIIVVRINNQGDFRLSKPCLMCVDVLRFVGIKRVFYSVNNKEIGVLKL